LALKKQLTVRPDGKQWPLAASAGVAGGKTVLD
jgi:hypothetical protein